MGLFDQIAGQVGGLLGGGEGGGGALGGLGGLIEQQGGVAGLVEAFNKAGLGGVAQSWVQSGANLPISADQLTAALGSGPVAEFAQKLGIDPQEAASHLSELIPQVVDHLTPNGEVQSGAVGALEGLLDKFKGG
jgi:uncharacterized protein YidB (DUF937 family)